MGSESTSERRDLHFLEFLAARGWRERDIERRAARVAEASDTPSGKVLGVYRARLSHELSEVSRRGVVRYFLMIRDIVAEARRRGIAVGPGRGSAAGSLLLYLLGVTNVDPIEHDLLFERFLAPGRIDLPDIDLDFEDLRRDELFAYLKEKFGREHVARVGTVSRMKARSLIRDLGRVLMISIAEVNAASESVADNIGRLEFIADGVPALREFLELYPDVSEFANVLQGQVRALGVHAAGVVVSPAPVCDVIPIETRDDEIVTAFDLNGVSDCGLIKIDVLGLKNLSIIKNAIAIATARGARIDIDNLELDDRKTLDAFTRGDFVGVFQFDAPSAASLCRGVKFESFDAIVAMTSLDRPGTARSGLAQTYLERNADPSKVEDVHPIYDRITRETLGVPVYQEHVIKLCRELGGFTPDVADKIRKLIGKSKGAAALADYEEAFILGAAARGMPEERAAELWGQLCEFGGYSFNKSHATAYSMIAYTTQWLKVHHPLAFFAALIKSEKHEKILPLVREAESRGIKVALPDVQSAGVDYRIVGDEIMPSLVDIKFVSGVAVETIEKAQPFVDFADFVERARGVNRKVVESLIKAGSLRSLLPNTRLALQYLDKIWNLRDSPEGRAKIRKFVAATIDKPDFEKDELDAIAADVNPFVIRVHAIEKATEVISRTVNVSTVPPDKTTAIDAGFFIGAIVDYEIGEYTTDLGKARSTAIIEIDGGGIKPFRVKLDDDQFGMYDLASLKGDVVIVHYRRSYKLPVVQFIVSLSTLDNKLRKGEKLSPFELIVRRELPKGVRVVANIRTILDKRKNEMAFLTIMGSGKAVEGVVFASTWLDVREDLYPGRVVKVAVKAENRDGKKSIIFRRIKPDHLP